MTARPRMPRGRAVIVCVAPLLGAAQLPRGSGGGEHGPPAREQQRGAVQALAVPDGHRLGIDDAALDALRPAVAERGLPPRQREGGGVVYMAHADGSWARATAVGNERPTVHQGGPRRLWDALDQVRDYWLSNGELPVRGTRVDITPDGRTFLGRGKWSAELT